MTQIKYSKSPLLNISSVTLFFDDEVSKISELDKQQISFFKKEIDNDRDLITLQELGVYHYYLPIKKQAPNPEFLEKLRNIGAKLCGLMNAAKSTEICVNNDTGEKQFPLAVAEGISLANYQFLRYFKDKKKSCSNQAHQSC